MPSAKAKIDRTVGSTVRADRHPILPRTATVDVDPGGVALHERRAFCRRDRGNRTKSLRLQCADDDGNAGFDDSGLLGGDGGEGRAKVRLVIEVDGRDRGNGRCHDIGGVQASSQAGFPNHQRTLFFEEMPQCHHRYHFEESRMMFGRELRQQGP